MPSGGSATRVTNTELLRNLDSIKIRLDVMEATMQKHEEDMEELGRILKGSNGSIGLVTKMTLLENLEQNIHLTCPVRDVRDVMYGDKETPGLLEEVRKLKEFKDDFTKLKWLVAAACVASIITLLVDILIH